MSGGYFVYNSSHPGVGIVLTFFNVNPDAAPTLKQYIFYFFSSEIGKAIDAAVVTTIKYKKT